MKVLSQVKQDMEFNKNLNSLVDVLKTIAVSEFHVLERKMTTFERLTAVVETFFETFDTRYIRHPLVMPTKRPKAVVAVTSDKGLLGGLNAKIATTAINELNQTGDLLVVVGERGEMFVREKNISANVFPGIIDSQRHSQALQLRNYLFEQVLTGKVGAIKIVYARALSFTKQRIEMLQLAPYIPAKERDIAAQRHEFFNTIFESKPEDIVEYLMYLWMAQKIDEIFGFSRLAELAARFVHLEESSQKLQKLNKTLKLEYFRIRHELVDRNMRELFAARSLFKHA